jgi:hypothetical protein
MKRDSKMFTTDNFPFFPASVASTWEGGTEVNGWFWGQLLDLLEQAEEYRWFEGLGEQWGQVLAYGGGLEINVYPLDWKNGKLKKMLDKKTGRYICPAGMRLVAEGDRDLVIKMSFDGDQIEVSELLELLQRVNEHERKLAELRERFAAAQVLAAN